MKPTKRFISIGMSPSVARRKYGHVSNAPICFKLFEVDLEKLSPSARAVAENICTTNKRDDASNVFLEGATQREVKEYVEKLYENKDYLTLHELGYWGNREQDMENFAMAETCFGIVPEKRRTTLWRFDVIREHETPEEYFERQVEKMRENGWIRILSGPFNPNIDFAL